PGWRRRSRLHSHPARSDLRSPSMVALAQNCPRCEQPLQRAEVRGVALDTCTKCKGMLVPQLSLPKLLAAMSDDLLKSFDPDATINPVKDAGGGIACPGCDRPMQTDNYCGAGIVFFDRCERCSFLWLDAEELGAMTLMWTRMEGRRIRDR